MFDCIHVNHKLRLKYQYIVVCWDCKTEMKVTQALWVGPKCYCSKCSKQHKEQTEIIYDQIRE